jgi:hypothetical protein
METFAMRKTILLILFLLTACAGESQAEKLSLKGFNDLSLQKKSEYFNSLKQSDRMNLLKIFLPGNCFQSPPNTDLRFFSDGTVIFDWLVDDSSRQNNAGGGLGGPYFFRTAFWHIENNRLIFKKDSGNTNSKEIFDIADEDSWWEVKTMYTDTSSPKILSFEFDGRAFSEAPQGGGTLNYSGFGCNSPAIREYTRLKGEGKK